MRLEKKFIKISENAENELLQFNQYGAEKI